MAGESQGVCCEGESDVSSSLLSLELLFICSRLKVLPNTCTASLPQLALTFGYLFVYFVCSMTVSPSVTGDDMKHIM